MRSSYILSGFPSPEVLAKICRQAEMPLFREVNGHIHTPYSFSAFDSAETIFKMAREENISVLGINDFYVTDGFDEFYHGCLKNGIFPLFNIEFIGLTEELRQKGVRVNDPNNPGRIYFCGKGLDYPFHLSQALRYELDAVKEKTQEQLRSMTGKLNRLISTVRPGLSIDFDNVRNRFARKLVRERHLAKAVRMLAAETFKSPGEQMDFIEALYGGRRSKYVMEKTASLEDEIRGYLLKAGGPAFVEEDESAFMAPAKIKQIISDAGGIPCYPVLLDDPSGNLTGFESDFNKLAEELCSMETNMVELIPGRNDPGVLRNFTGFFYDSGFVVTFGTEHNTPAMEPLSLTARGKTGLDNMIKETAWKGACLVAAHQYLRAKGEKGFVSGKRPDREQRDYFEQLGRNVIEHYLKTAKDETGTL